MNYCYRKFASVENLAPLIVAWWVFGGFSAMAADSFDASELVEKNCTSCHGSEIYTREDRKINSFTALKTQVQACNSNFNAGMSQEQLAAIATLLNEKYYKFNE